MVMGLPPIVSCSTCPCGRAAGVRFGGRCPLVDRRRLRGETICLEGEPAHSIWFVKRGAVLLSRAGTDGVERPRTVRGPGAFVGLEALVLGCYADTARCTEPSVLCGASRETFESWIGPAGTPARMALEQTLLATCGEVPRAASSDGSSTQRVARWIADSETHAHAEIPRQVLASMLGMVPETLSRALARLRDAGAIALTRRSVSIRDRQRLEELAR